MRSEALAATVARMNARGGAILCYHGLVSPNAPGTGIAHVTVEELLGHVEALRSVGEVVPLSTLLARHARGRSTARLFALTFDDAYASLLSTRALLDARQLPIAIFVCTDPALQRIRFWWDRVDDLFPHVDQA